MGIAPIGVRLAARTSEDAGEGFLYSWPVPGDERRGGMLFTPAERVLRECDETGAVPADGMEIRFGVSGEEWTRRRARWEGGREWRAMVTAAYGVRREFRTHGEPPQRAHRPFR
ncbi:hypothetical protein ACF07S_27175 [Streptomyces sp. NPDC016640]|uniref:hypothetical protein n=1 Tax=Streptomyces sp. NPDC016640 TaxID=3364969 RepID=UPI0037023224